MNTLRSFFAREHTPVTYSVSSTPPPLPTPAIDGEVNTFQRSEDDRLWLFRRQWMPTGPIRATLIVVHGTVDHSGYYGELGQALAAAGVAVFAHDMRGWGRSDGESYYFHDRRRFVADVAALYRDVHADPRLAGVRCRFLLGKSVGGLVTAYTALAHPEMFTGLIGLSGGYALDPSIGLPPPPVVGVLRRLSRLLPKLPVKRLYNDRMLMRDPSALAAWRHDPLVRRDRMRLGYVAEMLACNGDLPARVSEIRLPMLMMWGSEDRVVTRAGHEMMLERSSTHDATFKIYEGGLHNMLQEPDLGPLVIADIVDWVLERSSSWSPVRPASPPLSEH